MKRVLAFLVQATTPGDRVLLLGVWGGMVLLAAQALGQGPGDEAVVRVDGEIVERVALDRDRPVRVEGPQGTAGLRVRDGAIRFVHSPCTGKRCLRRGWLSQAGEAAACVPNRVLVQVTGSSNKGWDAVNY